MRRIRSSQGFGGLDCEQETNTPLDTGAGSRGRRGLWLLATMSFQFAI